MSHEHREADGQGGRAEAAIAPLVGHGEDADHQLHGEEDLHGGSHAQADAWLQLQEGRAAEGEMKVRRPWSEWMCGRGQCHIECIWDNGMYV